MPHQDVRRSRPAAPSRRPSRRGVAGDVVDLAVAVGLVLVAVLVAASRPEGDAVRLAVAAPVVLVVPGYLLLQAALVPARSAKMRVVHAAAAIGLSPVVLGLAALATALVPGGFQTGPIVAVVTVFCLALAALAGYRRAVARRDEYDVSGGAPRNEYTTERR